MVAVTDWLLEPHVPLRFFYILPVVFAAGFLSRTEVGMLALACTVLRAFSSGESQEDGPIARSATLLLSYVGTGLFVSELVRSQRRTAALMRALRVEQSGREEAERDLRALVASTPAAVLTLDAEARVVHANEAAHRMLGCDPDTLQGQSVQAFLPDLREAVLVGLTRDLRISTPCRALRRNGEPIHAQAWYSTYQSHGGRRLVAIIADLSDQFRDREEMELQQWLAGSQALVAALAHEVRNLSAAGSLLYRRLATEASLSGNRDFEALGTVIAGMGKIADAELRPAAHLPIGQVDLAMLLDDLRVVMASTLADHEIAITVSPEPNLPQASGEHLGLLQVLLNLSHNARRAMPAGGSIHVSAQRSNDRLLVRFQDSGPGVTRPESLFRAFQPGADSTGLGLYISRAIVRDYGGDLRYVGSAGGSCFELDLAVGAAEGAA